MIISGASVMRSGNEDGHPAHRSLEAAFRGAMRNMAATVTLLTTCDESGPHGIAVSAILSIPTDPPTLLVSVSQSSSIYKPLVNTGRFCINILGYDQAHLLLPFTSSDLRGLRFQAGQWEKEGMYGLPVLPMVVGAIVCTTREIMAQGAHSLFFGEVQAVIDGHRRAPLVWYDGAQADLEIAASSGG